MPTFLFTAVNAEGKPVTERVEAENLSAARYKLEIRGYSEITFYESELSHETAQLFSKEAEEARKVFLENQVGVIYDTRLSRHFFNLLKATGVLWAICLGFLCLSPGPFSLLILALGVAALVYISIPVIVFNQLYKAHTWNKNSRVRFWAGFARSFNPITVNKIPPIEIDAHLSCADAREGNLETALRRMTKYQNDPQVSRRLYNTYLARVYGNARKYDEVLYRLEETLSEDGNCNEELLDYALCLARRHKRTGEARAVLQGVLEREMSVFADLFIPYCQGVIEVEEGNLPQAEFHLSRAVRELEPFRQNRHMDGLRCEVKAFFAIVLGKRGAREEARKLFAEARPYLAAHNDTDLLRRCEEAVS